MEYEFKTTFYNDFSIADKFGADAIRDTYDRAFNEWKTDYIYLTELVLVLNWKLWEYYNKYGDCPYARLYNELWEKAQSYGYENLKGEELTYFYNTLD